MDAAAPGCGGARGATHEAPPPWLAAGLALLVSAAILGTHLLGPADPPTAAPSQPPLVVVLEADLDAVPEAERPARLAQLARVAEQRGLAAGARAARAEVLECGRVAVEIDGLHNLEQVTRLLSTSGRFEVREADPTAEGAWVLATVRDASGAERALTGQFISRARVSPATDARRALVLVELDAEGRELLANLTERLLGERLALFVDDELLMALTVRSAITGGQAQVSGGFSDETAHTLAATLTAGELPVPVRVVEATSP